MPPQVPQGVRNRGSHRSWVRKFLTVAVACIHNGTFTGPYSCSGSTYGLTKYRLHSIGHRILFMTAPNDAFRIKGDGRTIFICQVGHIITVIINQRLYRPLCLSVIPSLRDT